jgi:hypothetical protein
VLPELFHGLIIKALVAGVRNDPGSCAIPESRIEGFEAGHFCHHLGGPRSAPAWRDKLRVVRQEPKHPLWLAASRESTHRIRMAVCFLSPVGGRVVGTEDEGTDHCIAPRDMLHKGQLELGKIPQRFHPCVFLRPAWRPSGRLMPIRRDLEALVEVVQAGCGESLESWS